MSNKRFVQIVNNYLQSSFINPSDFEYLKELNEKSESLNEDDSFYIPPNMLVNRLYEKIPKVLKMDSSFAEYIKLDLGNLDDSVDRDANYIANLIYNFAVFIGHDGQDVIGEIGNNLRLYAAKTVSLFIEIILDVEFSARELLQYMELDSLVKVDEFFKETNVFELKQPTVKDFGLLYSKDVTYVITPLDFGPLLWTMLHLAAVCLRETVNKAGLKRHCNLISIAECKDLATSDSLIDECTRVKMLTCQFRDFLLYGIQRSLKCNICIDNYMDKLKLFNDRFNTPHIDFVKLVYDMHNKVNETLLKPQFTKEQLKAMNKRLLRSVAIHKGI